MRAMKMATMEKRDVSIKFRTTSRKKQRWATEAKLYSGGNLTMLIEDAMENRPRRFLVEGARRQAFPKILVKKAKAKIKLTGRRKKLARKKLARKK